MNINATIVVQAVNFFVAYLLFRTLLFKPAYAAIQQEQEAHDALHEQIAKCKEGVQAKEHERQLHWQVCQQYFEENQPPLPGPDQILFRNIAPKVAYPELSKGQVSQLTQKTTQLIIKKIGQHNDNH